MSGVVEPWGTETRPAGEGLWRQREERPVGGVIRANQQHVRMGRE
jgi:hypothetical protein